MTREPERACETAIATWLAVCFGLLYLLFGHASFSGSDEVAVFDTTEALWTNGSLAIPAGPHVYPGRHSNLYGHFAVGQSLIGLPFYALGETLNENLPDSARRVLASWAPLGTGARSKGSGRVEIFATQLYPPIASGVLVGLFYAFSRALGSRRSSALWASVLLGSGTYVALLSTFYLRHVTESLLVLGSFFALHRHSRTGSWKSLLIASALASGLVLVRIPALLALPGLAGYGLWAVLEARGRRRGPAPWIAAAAIGIPAALALGLHLLLNVARWGTWVASPMLAQAAHFDTPLYVGLWGFLLSPGASIFIYTPLLALLPWTLPEFWRNSKAECVAVIAMAVSFLLVCASFQVWSGLWSAPGPRYLYVLTPLLMLPLGPWLDTVRTRRTFRILVVGLGLLGASVCWTLVLVSWPALVQTMGYHDYPQPMDFVFVPELHPLIGAFALISDGRLDGWLWHLAQGWPGRAGNPALAAMVFFAWLALAGGALAMLVRAIRRAPGAP